MEKIYNLLLRYSTVIIIGVIALLLFVPGLPEYKIIAFIVFIEALAIVLSGLASWAYLSLPMTKFLNEGEDGKMNSVERHSVLGVISKIFLSVHILVGFCVLGVYIALK